MLEVVRAGMLTTVQDAGRPGFAHLGVPRSGALDGPSFRLANRLVGNPEEAAVLETTVDGVAVRAATSTTVAVTGAMCAVRVGDRPGRWGVAQHVAAGQVVDVGPALTGLRSYLAVAGGITVAPVLASRSTDLLSGLGPDRLEPGAVLPVGAPAGPPAAVDIAPYAQVGDESTLRITLGPRHDRVVAGDLDALPARTFTVSSTSNRIGVRLDGPPLRIAPGPEMVSEGLVWGAVQLPGSGLPLVFLADHPTTGGYPVIGVVVPEDLPAAAQARPGSRVRLLPV